MIATCGQWGPGREIASVGKVSLRDSGVLIKRREVYRETVEFAGKPMGSPVAEIGCRVSDQDRDILRDPSPFWRA